MELSKLLLGAVLLGITVETSSCVKDKKLHVQPTTQTANDGPTPGNGGGDDHSCCPACGMG